jgi:gas vesicle protein
VVLQIIQALSLKVVSTFERLLLMEQQRGAKQGPEYPGILFRRRKNFMNKTGRTALAFLTGLGIGAGLAALFAPWSGEETREWIADTAEREFKVLRRRGRQSIRQLEDVVAKGEETVTEVLRSGKAVLESVAAKLD